MSSPDIGADEIDAVVRVLRTPCLSIGPAIASFEEACAEYVGARYGVGVSSGTRVSTFEPSWKDAVGCAKQTAATRLRHKAQGWPRFLRPTLGLEV